MSQLFAQHNQSIPWSFRVSISPSNEYSVLVFFRNDWFDLLAVQGTLKSLLQHHKWNESESRSVVFDSLQPHDYKVHGIL